MAEYGIELRGKDLGIFVGGTLGISQIGVFVYSDPPKTVTRNHPSSLFKKRNRTMIPRKSIAEVLISGKTVWERKEGQEDFRTYTGKGDIVIRLNPDIKEDSDLVNYIYNKGLLGGV